MWKSPSYKDNAKYSKASDTKLNEKIVKFQLIKYADCLFVPVFHTNIFRFTEGIFAFL